MATTTRTTRTRERSVLHEIFKNNLKRAREKAGLRQREVADRLGIAQASYAAIEAGKSCPSIKQLERVAAAIGVSPLSLLRANGEK